MGDYRSLSLIIEDMTYKAKTGKSIEDTLQVYHGLARLAGFAAGVVGGAYVANEAMEWLASDAPYAVRYAVDGLAALMVGRPVARATGKFGLGMGLRKVKKVLDEENP